MSGRDLFCQPRRIRRGAALTLVFASVLVAGAATGSFPDADRGDRKSSSDAARSAAPAGHHEDVAEAAEEAVADGSSPMEAAERAVSRSGDRWGAVYSRGEYEEFEEALDGQYTGVGLWARRERDGRIEVTKVSSDSPAASAGIRKGDRLRSVDGEKVDGHPVTGWSPCCAATPRTRPPVRRSGWASSAARTRGRRPYGVPVCPRTRSPFELAGGITVIKIDSFTKGVGDQVRDAVREAPADGGIVLDLRGNSGGLVAEAVTTASVFLDGGLVATYDVDGSQQALHAEPGGDTTRALVALVDGGTMSAAELLTGALQDRGRAVVVGSRTFGKGSVQMPSRLPDGAVAELTVGHYRTPSGRGVDGRGITPDLEADEGALRQAETVLGGLGDAD